MFCDILGISNATHPEIYLGLPVISGRSKSEALSFVKERVYKKVQGWKHNLLSQAGREILIKAVASAIPMYPMVCFKFPKGVCDSLNSAITRFWWGQKEDEGKYHWVSWKKLTVSKEFGRMGFKDFEEFNLSLLAKQCWRFLNSPDDFWVKMFKGSTSLMVIF